MYPPPTPPPSFPHLPLAPPVGDSSVIIDGYRENSHTRRPITNRQRFLTLSSLVEGLNLKVTGSKMSITSDDLLFARRQGTLANSH